MYINGELYFVVSWNNVPDDSGNPQTFQVLIKVEPGWEGNDYHNLIFFQYKSITKNCLTAVGIEDQVGNKGTDYDYNNLHDQARLRFVHSGRGYRLGGLKIKLTKSDGNARIEILELDTGGYNVDLMDHTNPYGNTYKFALKKVVSSLLAVAGVIFKGMLILADFVEALSSDISPSNAHIQDARESDPEAWAQADCQDEDSPLLGVFDSTLATGLLWEFVDANDRDHDITVSAEALYRDLDAPDDVYTVSTSLTLNMRLLRHINIETCKTDGSAISNVRIWVDGVQYYSPTHINLTRGTHTVQAELYFYRRVYWLYTFHHWEDDSRNNTRIISAEDDMNMTAYYYECYCPTLFVWNGYEFVYETLLNIHAETDVTVQHQIQQTLVLDGLFYKLQLRELDNFTSHIDQVKLYAIDQNGEWHKCPLTIAKHNGTYVTLKLLFDDEWRVDLKPSQTIDLKFIPSIPYSQTTHFIFEINGHNKKIP